MRKNYYPLTHTLSCMDIWNVSWLYYTQPEGVIFLRNQFYILKENNKSWNSYRRICYRFCSWKKTLPSVVTIGYEKTTPRTPDRIQLNPFDPYSPYKKLPGEDKTLERNIGSGFTIAPDLIVTNKHVVSDADATYSIVNNDHKTWR